MTTLAYAGTFNPFTTGHSNLIMTALKLVNKIVIIVAQNPSKATNAQKDALEYVTAWVTEENLQDRVTVVVGGPKELSVDIAAEHNCTGFIRGMRNLVDFEAEKELAHMNENVVGDLPTFHIISPANLISVSSTVVRNLTGTRNWWNTIRDYLPKSVYTRYLRNYIRENVCPVSDEVMKGYTGSAYHSLEHVVAILYQIEKKYKDHVNYQPMKYTALYHDCVKSDIAASIRLMKKELPESIWDIEDVASDYISNTAYDEHFVPDEFSDCDLSILISPWKEYQVYMHNIRAEYAHVSDEQFNKGRREFLNGMLQKRLFTDSKYDIIAYSNMEKELECLI
jgi:pantetheine-phosphate adenylyltransferase